jgi:hypothetical protein
MGGFVWITVDVSGWAGSSGVGISPVPVGKRLGSMTGAELWTLSLCSVDVVISPSAKAERRRGGSIAGAELLSFD